MVFIHRLFMLSKLLHKLRCCLHYIQWGISERADLDCFDIRFVQKLMIRSYLNLTIEVSRHNQKLLRGSHGECNILRIVFTVIHEFLLSIALNHILRVQAIHAVIIEKEEISSVN